MKTTKADFELFKQSCEKWIDKLGLKEWSIHFDHEKLDDVYAQTYMNGGGKVATIVLAHYWDDMRPKTTEAIDRLALHEVLHVLMNPLVTEAHERYTTQWQLEGLEHEVIRRLENLA